MQNPAWGDDSLCHPCFTDRSPSHSLYRRHASGSHRMAPGCPRNSIHRKLSANDFLSEMAWNWDDILAIYVEGLGLNMNKLGFPAM